MQAKTWMQLIEKVPPHLRDGLGLITASGVEINITSVMRMEEEFFVIRGRLMGSTDANHTFFVPYDQINCVIFQRMLKEPEIMAWFDGPPAVAASPAPAQAAAADQLAEDAAVEPAAQTLSTASATQTGAASPFPGKAAILERLRKRTGTSAPGIVKKPLPGPTPAAPPRPAPKPPEKQ